MSEIAESKIDKSDVSVNDVLGYILEYVELRNEAEIKENVNVENVNVENVNVENVKEEINVENVNVENVNVENVNVENVNEIPIKTFIQLFEIFLTQDKTIFSKLNLNITPEIQKYFLILCKESPDLFGTLEETLKKIIVDNRIDTKDIPNIIVLVSKIYRIIRENKGIPNVDPYDVIKTLLHISLIIYIETNKVENPQLLFDLLQIIDSSIDLIKLTPIVPKKMGCFRCCM